MYDSKNSFRWLNEQKQSMMDLLIKLADQNSGTKNARGMGLVANIIKEKLVELGADIVQQKLPGYTDIDLHGIKSNIEVYDFIVATKREKSDRSLLLGGHLDTVYEKNEKKVAVEGDYLIGPGVADMKGGLVVMLYALQAFEKLNIKNKIGWQIFLDSDEEIGSIGSKQELTKLAKKHQLAFIFEPAINLRGDISGNRMGSGKFTIVVVGKSAHVGRDFNNGKNAIIMLAAIVQKIHNWNSLAKDIIINVGKIFGGDAVNKIPDLAVAKIDVRFSNKDIADWFKNKINSLIKEFDQSLGYSVQLYGKFTRPVKKLTDKAKEVSAKVQQIANSLNQHIDVVDTGGCCDGNNLAEFGCITIDTLGVLGDNIHSSSERMLIDSLVSRSQLVLELMLNYQQGKLL